MKRIIVIGCPGAGKSCFARLLRDKTGIPLHYLDRIWHKPDKSSISTEEFDFILKSILEQREWIIDGNYKRTLEMRLKACDTVFFLDYPVKVCLDGAISRIGKEREEMPWIETELDEEFKESILNYPKEQRPYINKLLDENRCEKTIHIFSSRSQAEEYISAAFPTGEYDIR